MENDQRKFNSWLRSEVVAAFAIGSVVASMVLWLTSPIHDLNIQMAVIQNQIAELKSNDLVHIELALTTQNARLDEIQKQVFDTVKTISALVTYIKQ